MRWQLQTLVDGWAHRDYQFPLQQFSGANVNLPNLMTVIHPVRSAGGRGQLPRAAAAHRRADGRGDGAVGAAGGPGHPAAALHPAGHDRPDAPVRLVRARREPAGHHLRRAPGQGGGAGRGRAPRPRRAGRGHRRGRGVSGLEEGDRGARGPASRSHGRRRIVALPGRRPGLRGPPAAVHVHRPGRAGDPRHRAAGGGAPGGRDGPHPAHPGAHRGQRQGAHGAAQGRPGLRRRRRRAAPASWPTSTP